MGWPARRRTRRRVRALAIAVALLALLAGIWVTWQRTAARGVSDLITRPAPEYGPTAQVLLPDLRDAVVVVPDRPHDPAEARAPDAAQKIHRTRRFFVSTNSLGLRGPEISLPAPGFRILAVGDSVTFGWGVPAEGAWPALLAERLGVEVLNAGVPAQKPASIAAWTAANAARLDVDLVLFARRPDRSAPDPRGDFQRALRELSRALGPVPLGVILPPVSSFDPAGRQGAAEEARAARADLAPVPVLDLDPQFQVAQIAPGVLLQVAEGRQRVIDLADRRVLLDAPSPAQGLAVEIAAAFEANLDWKEPLFFDGGHPDEAGLQRFADAVAEFVRLQGWLPDAARPTSGQAPLIPAVEASWAQDPPPFVPDPAFYGEASWDDVRGRVAQHQAIVLRDRARLAATRGDLRACAARYREAVAWLDRHPIATGIGAELHALLLAANRRDAALAEALASGAPPPLPPTGLARLQALRLSGASQATLAKEAEALVFLPLDPSAFADFQDRHRLRLALVEAALDASDPFALPNRWGTWDPASRAALRDALVTTPAGATVPIPEDPPRFSAEGLGSLPTGDSWVDVAGEPGPAAIGRLEVLSLEDPTWAAHLDQEAARLQQALEADPASVPAALTPLLRELEATPYTSRYYNLKAARNEAVRQLARAGAYGVAARILAESFPLRRQDFACPNRAGILQGIRARLLALAGDPEAEAAMSEALVSGEAFLARIDAVDPPAARGL